MTQRQFQLVSEWRFHAPLNQVWDALCAVEDWPGWWTAVRRVEALMPGDEQGVGAMNRFHWRTALPYDLAFVMTVVDIEPMRRIEGQASGELEGTGIWTLNQVDGVTFARYDWRVDVTRPWMRRVAPLLTPVFAWNHGVVMGRGERGLRRLLERAQG